MKGTNEHLGISGAPLTLPDLPKPIRNRDLTLADVPAFDVRTLNLDWREGPSMPQWFELWVFALTFNGYRYTGLEIGPLGLVAESLHHHHSATELAVYPLGWLRAFLFIEQRRWKWISSERCEHEHAAYLQALLEEIRTRVDRQQARLIQTKHLREADVPHIDAESPETPADVTFGDKPHATFREVWAFARTFDAYRYFAVDDVHGRLGEFARSVKEEYLITGRVPRLGEIGMLRACLFYEERRWCTWNDDHPGMTSDDVRYLSALVGAIRSRLP